MQLSLRQAAIKANKTEKTIRSWIDADRIIAHKENNCWKIDEASLSDCLTGKNRGNGSNGKAKGAQPAMPGEEMISQIAAKMAAQLCPQILAGLGQANEKQDSSQEILALKEENEVSKKRIEILEGQIQGLTGYIKEIETRLQAKPIQPVQPENSRQSSGQPSKTSKAGQADDSRALKWVREHIDQWIDQPCPFKQAGDRSWREMASNIGEKIVMNGKGEQSPRAYLHAIENWKSCNVWSRVKAKVALEVAKNNSNHYNRPEEIGG